MDNESSKYSKLRKIAADIQKREDIDSSLRRARREQFHMLPAIPEIPGYKFAAEYIPAGEIGGDFYDFVKTGPNQWGIILGDVTGHGIEAAIIMGMAKKTLSICSRNVSSPYDALLAANEELHGDLLPTRFVSAAMLILDVVGHQIHYARAGHNPLIIYNKKRPEALMEIAPSGTVLGIMKNKTFGANLEIKSMPVYSGDFILLYTDGITEARASSNEEFGVSGLKKVIEDNPTAPTQVILEKMIAAARTFSGQHDFEDDVTLIAFRVGE